MKRNNEKGITLVALIVTIVVMLVLVAVSASIIINSDLIGQAKKTAEWYKKETEKEAGKSTITIDGVEYPCMEAYNAYLQIADEANFPKLGKDMKAVYWETVDGELKERVQGDKEFEWVKWYNYKNQEAGEDGNSKWANAITEDGSYWVWIPRYEYKITYYKEEAKTTPTVDNVFSKYGTIDINFIPTSQTEASSNEYKIHPAFQDGTENNFKNGEWDEELAGIWVAKYEMAMEEYSGETWKQNTKKLTGNYEISDTIRMVSKPNLISWRAVRENIVFKNSYNYSRENNSHLIKNSEWGAIAYLAYSSYGRNGKEVAINGCSQHVTGAGPAEIDESKKSKASESKYSYTEDIVNFKDSIYAWNSLLGQMASTTGNLSGVYDMVGGSTERTAGYITNGNSALERGIISTEDIQSGVPQYVKPSDAGSVAYPNAWQTESTKYATVYPYYASYETTQNTSDTPGNNRNAYKGVANTTYGYGDAILETPNWFEDKADFGYVERLYFDRGANYDDGRNAGLFCLYTYFANSTGNITFRVVLAI